MNLKREHTCNHQQSNIETHLSTLNIKVYIKPVVFMGGSTAACVFSQSLLLLPTSELTNLSAQGSEVQPSHLSGEILEATN